MPEPGLFEAAAFATAARAAAAHVFVEDLGDPLLGPDDRHHLERVLRLRPGETVSAVDGQGGWRLCAFNGGRLEAAGEIRRVPPVEPSVAVGFAPTKGDRPEWAVQKLTEIGVERIIPLITVRGVVHWEGDRAERHLKRLREVARQAGMQSRRLTLPVVEALCSPVEAFEAAPPGVPALAEPGGDRPSLNHPMILVGPEGGWDPSEVVQAPATVTLGGNILRTETAAIVAGTLLVAMRSGLVGPLDA
jgi:16S rRNA (uracil1498-N3)-methyltransferase